MPISLCRKNLTSKFSKRVMIQGPSKTPYSESDVCLRSRRAKRKGKLMTWLISAEVKVFDVTAIGIAWGEFEALNPMITWSRNVTAAA